MSEMTLKDLAEKMRDIDIAMLLTHAENGTIAGRPMSNNGDVDYDGDSYYFTWEEAKMVADIEANPKVSLTFQGEKSFAVAVEGEAALIRDKARFAEHWTSELDVWFQDGVDTPGVVMIHVHAERVHYWDGEDQGEVQVPEDEQ